ncbi:8-oxo-dGTP diphosphatase [Brevibacterium sanguinis]|uniref:8-oxo-dGTP diphosphatase n=2 Tax=Brevibacterium TaxID=1696 RepID=A0A366ILG8_9MICO|nr:MULTISPECIES: NUDIX hydrolase [Brevibacterium]RBP65643.1 8-oxo-dGTP diphosphatase [Brevibacterium sanguinis]RBP72277.1 8-oxo-dGTP diphosphatase [Brevibacterium celere]
MRPGSVDSAQASSRVTADILAAGAVCWRDGHDGLEVALIHRPRYNDWSWPKGKVEAGETLPEAAIREVKEETGLDVHLGVPLPTAEYMVGGGNLKKVFYWSAHVRSDQPFAPKNTREVDEVRWFPVAEARTKLSSYADRDQLDALETFGSTDALRAWPLILVRHGKAFPRAKWHETEHVRPLLALGTRQAMALTGLLAAWDIRKLVSSPWKRCMATLVPFSAATGKPIRKAACLSEKAGAADPEKTARYIEKLLEKGKPTAYCTHRPVLPTILGVYAKHAPQGIAAKLPTEDPYLKPGEILVAYVRPGTVPRIVEIERFRPIDS